MLLADTEFSFINRQFRKADLSLLSKFYIQIKWKLQYHLLYLLPKEQLKN
jgi:hypothetical protein